MLSPPCRREKLLQRASKSRLGKYQLPRTAVSALSKSKQNLTAPPWSDRFQVILKWGNSQDFLRVIRVIHKENLDEILETAKINVQANELNRKTTIAKVKTSRYIFAAGLYFQVLLQCCCAKLFIHDRIILDLLYSLP